MHPYRPPFMSLANRAWRWIAIVILPALSIPLAGCGGNRLPARVTAVPPATMSWPADPRLAADVAFLNVAPDVRYVGDAACTPCHQRIAETYREHPMGQSLFPLAEAPVVERFGAAAFG